MNKQFWKNEAERLSESLCNKTMQGEQKVSLHQILTGYYPVIFKEYVKRHARKLLQEEHIIQINHSSRFNYDSLKLQEQIDQLKEAVLSETVFTRSEIEKFSGFVVAFQLDILLAPRQTFFNLTFRERNEFNKEAAIVILSGFDEDRPFVRRLKEALERIDKDTIYRDEIYKIAEKIEQKVFKLTPISALLQEINCYIEFESAATGDHQSLVCSELLLRLLKERNQLTLFKQFEAEAHDKDFWTITEIEYALERFLLIGGLEPLHEETAPQDRNYVAISKLKSVRTPRKKQVNAKQVDLQFSVLDDYESEPDDKNGNGSHGQDQAEINQKTLEYYPHLESVIPPDEQALFVSEIFEHDQNQYTEFIARLNSIQEWQEAKKVINEELVKRKISPYAKEAILLGDKVFSRYYSNK